jgi:thimet oligopeptidase
MDRRLVIARARLALELHDRPPGPVNIDSIALATLRESVPLELPAEEMHAEAGFMHLAGYAAAYYTYPWSQVIAADLASRFEANPLDPEVGREFRRAILEGGRAVPVEKKIEAFLGRPFRLDAWVKSIP